MSFTSVPLLTTGDWIDAAWGNTYWKDNMAALWPFTSAGDIAYAAGATSLSRLGKPSVDSLLKNTSAGVPSWLDMTDLFPVVAAHNNGTGHTYATNTWRDMPNSSASIVPAVTSTIVVHGVVVSYGSATYGERQFKFNINGTDCDTHVSHESYQINEWLSTPVMGFLTGVSAGSKTIKLREKCDAGSFTVERLFWLAMAAPE